MITALSILFLLTLQVAPAAAQQTSAGDPPRRGGGLGPSATPLDFDDHTGFAQIFDGMTMDNWNGTPEIWRIEDGAFVAESTPEKPAGTTFMIWEGGEVSDFELKLEVKIEGGGNGGIQYRSRNEQPDPNFRMGGGRGPGPGGQGQNPGGQGQNPAGQGPPPGGQRGPMGGAYAAWNLQGYQADFNPDGSMAGQLFEGGRFVGERGITTRPGQAVILREEQPPQLVANIATPEEVQANFNQNEWNQYHIVARGYTFLHIVNGKLISATVDDDPSKRVESGVIGLQIEGNNTKISYRNIWLKTLE